MVCFRSNFFFDFEINLVFRHGKYENYDDLWKRERIQEWVYGRTKNLFIIPKTDHDEEFLDVNEGPLLWVFLGLESTNETEEIYHMLKINEMKFKKTLHTGKKHNLLYFY